VVFDYKGGIMQKCFILIIAIGLCFASNYITNGDFEQVQTVGWTQSTYGSASITRGTTYDPDPDYEIYLYKASGTTGHATLYQIADIPTTHLDFKVNAKLWAWDNYGGAWAGAAVILSYLDASNTTLGDTRICMRSSDCPWTDGPTCHIIAVYDSLWHTYTFNIYDELANLAGVDASEVDKIKVTLVDSVIHC
jgi:hypothetical protein